MPKTKTYEVPCRGCGKSIVFPADYAPDGKLSGADCYCEECTEAQREMGLDLEAQELFGDEENANGN